MRIFFKVQSIENSLRRLIASSKYFVTRDSELLKWKNTLSLYTLVDAEKSNFSGKNLRFVV